MTGHVSVFDALRQFADFGLKDAVVARRDHPTTVSWQEFWRGRQGVFTDLNVWIAEQEATKDEHSGTECESTHGGLCARHSREAHGA